MALSTGIWFSMNLGRYSVLMKISKRRSCQKGPAAIETALLIIPPFLILLAMIDYVAKPVAHFAVTGDTSILDGSSPRATVARGSLTSALDLQITINYHELHKCPKPSLGAESMSLSIPLEGYSELSNGGHVPIDIETKRSTS
jgi:hypothetical protein